MWCRETRDGLETACLRRDGTDGIRQLRERPPTQGVDVGGQRPGGGVQRPEDRDAVAQPLAVGPEESPLGHRPVAAHDLARVGAHLDDEREDVAVGRGPVEAVGARLEQVGEAGKEGPARDPHGGPRAGGQDRQRDPDADEGADDGLLQPDEQHLAAEGVQQRVELPEHHGDEEDHRGVGQLLDVEGQEDAAEQGQHGSDRLSGGEVGQADGSDEATKGPHHARHALADRLARRGRAGEGDERGDDRPVVALG